MRIQKKHSHIPVSEIITFLGRCNALDIDTEVTMDLLKEYPLVPHEYIPEDLLLYYMNTLAWDKKVIKSYIDKSMETLFLKRVIIADTDCVTWQYMWKYLKYMRNPSIVFPFDSQWRIRWNEYVDRNRYIR